MNRRSLEQRRAGDALDKIRLVETQDTNAKLYASYVKALPATILQLGLGQAMATLLSAAKGNKQDAHYILYDHVSDWLCGNDEDAPYQGKTEKGLIATIVQGNESMYVHAQSEALAYISWLKKFAVAFLPSEDN